MYFMQNGTFQKRFQARDITHEKNAVMCHEYRDRVPKVKKKKQAVKDWISPAEAWFHFVLRSETPNTPFPLLTKRGKN